MRTGRPVGSTGRDNKAIKDMLREALKRRGNSDYFYEQAKENPVAFMGLIAKLIPAEIAIAANSAPLRVEHSLRESDELILNKFLEQKGVKEDVKTITDASYTTVK